MKILSILCITLFASKAIAQDCTTPVSLGMFQNRYSQIEDLDTDQKRLDMAVALTGSNCLTSNQLLLIARLFEKDQYRLEFGKLSYKNAIDKENFYDVYNAFTSFSYVFRLHDYVIANQKSTPIKVDPIGPRYPIDHLDSNKLISKKIVFPKFNYPPMDHYSGAIGCTKPMSNDDMIIIAKALVLINDDNARLDKSRTLLRSSCLSMAQSMKLSSLFNTEAMALEFLMGNFSKVYDQNNYPSVQQCFSNAANNLKWVNFCKDQLPIDEPDEPVITCDVNESEFKGMIQKIDRASFPRDQTVIVKSLNNHYCFYTAQVRRIIEEFSFPSDKIEMAKLLYDKCLDKEKYYTLKGMFSFPNYELEFEELIKAN